jgi:uncharacterized protein
MASPSSLRPSRFNMLTRDSDGSLLVYNSLSGALMEFRDEKADQMAAILTAESALNWNASLSPLASQGILVRSDSDELKRAGSLHRSLFERTDHLHLILMPTEKCNFRCVYCYEEFKRGRMSREVIESVVRLVALKAPSLRSLSVGWFGGEPLAAINIVEEISHRAVKLCAESGTQYSASMTTNGFLLTEERAERCFSSRITNFQITLDGPAETHNTLRVLAGGGDTFHTILENLYGLRSKTDDFHVRLRVNFTPQSAPSIPRFLQFLGEDFGGDPRFSISFHRVGHWGGPNDDLVEICDRKSADALEVEFMKLAFQAGFGLEAWKESVQVFGSACYASDPRSFVIGSDGTVYKCTVAFEDPRNRIGRISPDGTLAISDQLHALWTSSGEETDTGCQQCAFRPACQGNLCPLDRLNRNEKVCPPIKRNPDQYFPLLVSETKAHPQKMSPS